MSKNNAERRRAVKEAVYAAKGNGLCPYPPDTMEARHWARVVQHYWDMEAKMREMEEVYGR
jgi:hypothetical protein